MIYDIYHETIFNYATLVTFSHNIARLKPKNCLGQKLLDYSLKIEPTPYETSEFVDYFENTNNFMLIREAHTKLKVIATSKVERNIEEINEYMEKLTWYLDEILPKRNMSSVWNYKTYIGYKYKIKFQYDEKEHLMVKVRFIVRPRNIFEIEKWIFSFVESMKK